LFQTGSCRVSPVANERHAQIIGGILGLLALIGVGVGVGVGVTSANRSSKSTTSASASSSSSSSSSVTSSNPNDPSQFTKDSRLKKSFYGIAYTPEGSQLPNCGNKLADVITDIQLLSQLTTVRAFTLLIPRWREGWWGGQGRAPCRVGCVGTNAALLKR
jgi:hypothetical protein